MSDPARAEALVERLLQMRRVEFRLAHECDCPPEATQNWLHVQTIDEALAALQSNTPAAPADKQEPPEKVYTDVDEMFADIAAEGANTLAEPVAKYSMHFQDERDFCQFASVLIGAAYCSAQDALERFQNGSLWGKRTHGKVLASAASPTKDPSA